MKTYTVTLTEKETALMQMLVYEERDRLMNISFENEAFDITGEKAKSVDRLLAVCASLEKKINLLD